MIEQVDLKSAGEAARMQISLNDMTHAADLAAMDIALEQARMAYDLGEVPVGCVVVFEGRIISRAFNLRETRNDPTAHAERLALTSAGESLGISHLDGCTLYTTLEPCPMCAGAMIQARIARVVYGAADPKAGACDSLYRLLSDPRLNHQVQITRGLLAEPSRELLSRFFKERRRKIVK